MWFIKIMDSESIVEDDGECSSSTDSVAPTCI